MLYEYSEEKGQWEVYDGKLHDEQKETGLEYIRRQQSFLRPARRQSNPYDDFFPDPYKIRSNPYGI